METMVQSISAWLSTLGSHEIYTLTHIKEDFETHTGQKWPSYVGTYTFKQTRDAMRARGLGGQLEDSKDRCVWGYQMAADFAKHLTHQDASVTAFGRQIMGRGRIFYNAIELLEKAGL